MAKEFAGTKPYLHSDNQPGLKLSSMQQKVCDEILFSKSPLKEHAFKDDDLRSLPVVSEHFKYFKTPKCNDSLLFYLAQMREKAGKKLSTKINNPVLKAIESDSYRLDGVLIWVYDTQLMVVHSS